MNPLFNKFSQHVFFLFEESHKYAQPSLSSFVCANACIIKLIHLCADCAPTWDQHDSISIFMNNLVTSVRETDRERFARSMSSCLWHAKRHVHCVTASSSSTRTPTYSQYAVMHAVFFNLRSPLAVSHPSVDRMNSDMWETHQHFSSAHSVNRQRDCGDPNLTLN